MRSNGIAAASLLASVTLVQAHVTMWNVGLFGYNSPFPGDNANQSYNTNDPVIPLKQIDNRTQAEWWGHGMLALEPKKGDFMQLPSGGVFIGELGCNRGDTRMRDPVRNDVQPEFACGTSNTSDGIGALHVVHNSFDSPYPPNTTWFGGTAIAIAYTSDINAVKPSDMTVISVNYTSPWKRLTEYQIPAGLPACPDDGCLCTWNWIHRGGNGEGYPWEMYNNIYRCKILNGTPGKKISLGGGAVPSNCENSTSSCVSGPKQPIYVYQLDGNNQPFTNDPPTYNARYGFSDGAQSDALVVDTSYTSSATASSAGATGSTSAGTGAGAIASASASGTIVPTTSIRPSSARPGTVLPGVGVLLGTVASALFGGVLFFSV